MTDSESPPRHWPVPPGTGTAAREPALNVPPVTGVLVLLLGAVFVPLWLGPEEWTWTVVNYLGLVPARVAAILADPWRIEALPVAASLVTHALVHVEPLHFVLNAGFLLAFGSACERAFGRRRYAGLLLAGAAGGALAQIAADWGEPSLMHGASGVVSACMGAITAALWADPAHPQRRRLALALAGAMVGLNLLIGLAGGEVLGVEARIAWQAHLGGFAAGWLLGRAWTPAVRR